MWLLLELQDQKPTQGTVRALPGLHFNLHPCGKHRITPTTANVLACPCSKTQTKCQKSSETKESSPHSQSKAHTSLVLFPVLGTASSELTGEFPLSSWKPPLPIHKGRILL